MNLTYNDIPEHVISLSYYSYIACCIFHKAVEEIDIFIGLMVKKVFPNRLMGIKGNTMRVMKLILSKSADIAVKFICYQES